MSIKVGDFCFALVTLAVHYGRFPELDDKILARMFGTLVALSELDRCLISLRAALEQRLGEVVLPYLVGLRDFVHGHERDDLALRVDEPIRKIEEALVRAAYADFTMKQKDFNGVPGADAIDPTIGRPAKLA